MKLNYLNISLDDGKELIGVKTEGNSVSIIYKDTTNVRPIGFEYYHEEEEEEDGTNEEGASEHLPVVAK